MQLDVYQESLQALLSFLKCETPQAWIDVAIQPQNLKILLIDHMICELKAAQTAALLLRRYALDAASAQPLLDWLAPYEALIYHPQQSVQLPQERNINLRDRLVLKAEIPYADELTSKMLLLIREELHHFYQVWQIMQQRNIAYENITAGRYAKGLMRHVRTFEPATLVDKLICGALIEARSCERFAKLAPYVDETLSRFYLSLLRSEARHYQDYLSLAASLLTEAELQQRILFFSEREATLILESDSQFRFHSGVPYRPLLS